MASVRKIQVIGRDDDCPQNIWIFDHHLEIVHDIVYLGSSILDYFFFDTELNSRISKAATTMSRLAKIV